MGENNKIRRREESCEEFAIFVGRISNAMKRILSFLLILAAAVSCGNRQEKQTADLLESLREMREAYEDDENEDLLKAFHKFGDAVRRLDDAAATLAAFEAYMDEVIEDTGWKEDYFFNRTRQIFINNPGELGHPVEIGAITLFMTRLYDAADEIIWHHHPSRAIGRYRGIETFAIGFIPRTSYYYEEQREVAEPWNRKQDAVREQREQAWAAADRQWDGKRIVTKDAVGPIKLGSSIKDLPDSMEGFYDYLDKRDTFLSYAETDIAWEETHYLAWYKDEVVFDLMTTVRDMDMFDDYEQPEDTDWDEIVQFEVKSKAYQTPTGLSINMEPEELIDAGGVGFYYDRGEYIYNGIRNEKEFYGGIYAEGLLFQCEDSLVIPLGKMQAADNGWDAYCFGKEFLWSPAKPRSILSVGGGWIDPFLDKRLVMEEPEEGPGFLFF